MHTEERIRTFIAIKISSELKDAFTMFIGELNKIRGGVKWVKPESIHLTLKFLGNLSASKIDPVTQAVREACSEFSSFHLRTATKGAFPNLRRPRVFWIGLTETDDHVLANLQARIEAELAEIGFKRESREFHPHLTVSRVRSLKNIKEITKTFMDYLFPEIEFNVDQVLVMRSELTPKGAIYSVQNTVPLKITEI